jgi:NTE family protein
MTAVASGLLLALLASAAAAGDLAGRPRIGLALGGGSAKGLAHAGVLRWLEEHRIPVDVIAGTSMGALVGGAYATGLSPAQIGDLLSGANWDGILRPDPPFALKSVRRKQDARAYPVGLELGLRGGRLRLPSGFNPGHRIGLLLSRIALPFPEPQEFDDLPIPFRCVATDMEKGEPVVLSRGSLGGALRASMAIPGVFDPVRLDGRLLSDGGVLNNVPVDVVRGMGADVVIAVNVASAGFEPLHETAAGLADRAISLMLDELTASRLGAADLVILPDLRGVGSTDYRDAEAIMARGYRAADALAGAFAPLALSPGDWEAYRQARRERLPTGGEAPASIEVVGASEATSAGIQEQLQPLLGRPLDPDRVEAELDGLVGTGRFASASYGMVRKQEGEGLLLTLREKPYAPPLLNFSLDMSNEQQGIDFNLGARVTWLDPTSYGSEARIDLALGAASGLGGELFQPLGDGGVFLAPRALYRRIGENLYQAKDLVAVYRRERAGVGADLGLLLGRGGELRLGYDHSYLRNVRLVGEPTLPEPSGGEGVARAAFSWDGFDSATLPRRGLRLRGALDWFLKAPETDGGFGQASISLGLAWPIGGRDRVIALLDGGAGLGPGGPPVLYQFPLGGPFRLSAFGIDELRGRDFALARILYLKSLARLGDFFAGGVYLTALVEAGSAFDHVREAHLAASATLGLTVETLVGPAFLGASLGNSGRARVYFSLGKLIRDSWSGNPRGAGL